jgi:hypothetical protein
MNRTLSCFSICVLLLIAVGVCIKQTIEFRALLDTSTLIVLLGAEAIAAGALVTTCLSLFRRQFARPKKQVNRRPVALVVQA